MVATDSAVTDDHFVDEVLGDDRLVDEHCGSKSQVRFANDEDDNFITKNSTTCYIAKGKDQYGTDNYEKSGSQHVQSTKSGLQVCFFSENYKCTW